MEEKKRVSRLEMGEAWMFCGDCYARLYSFDGYEDRTTTCPYKKDAQGKCTDQLKK